MEVYDRSRGREADTGEHPFTNCDCGSQVQYIDTVDGSVIKSECFLLFWYDPEKGCIEVAQHMGISVKGLEILCKMMAKIIEGSMKSLGEVGNESRSGSS